jgi:hypothetical protein
MFFSGEGPYARIRDAPARSTRQPCAACRSAALWLYKGRRGAQVRQEARVYWWLRAGLAPLVLLNMALSGILQARHLSLHLIIQ